MPTSKERMRILESLEKGEISPEEAARLLAEGKELPPEKPLKILERLEQGEISADEAAQRLGAGKQERPIDTPVEVWDNESVVIEPAENAGDAWKFLLGLGVAVVILSGAWMAYLLSRSGMNFWFYCAWLPLALGVALTAFGWFTRNSTWMQLNVRAKKSDDRRIYFSLPLPVEAVVRWASRFGRNPKLTFDFTDSDDEE